MKGVTELEVTEMKRWLAVFGLVLTASACASPMSNKITPEGKVGPGAYRVWLGDGFNRSLPMTVVDGSGKPLRTLPQGAAASDWSRLYTIDRGMIGSQHLVSLDPASGATINKVEVPSAFDFPQAIFASRASALSPNNGWVVLQSLDRKGQQGVERSHYLVFDKDFKSPARKVDLKGYWEYDGLSNDGNSLFLLEYASQPPQPIEYHVRRYDLAAGQVVPGVIVDKREGPAEAMTGLRVHSIPTPDGSWLYSLYIFGRKGPFIHALKLEKDPFAWCIDLPSKASDSEQQMLWSMAMTAEGRRVYAVNAAEGTVSEIAVNYSGPPTVIRTARFKVSNPQSFDWFGLVINAEAKRVLFGGAALSIDGKTLYAIGYDGVYAIDTTNLTLKGHFLAGHAIDSLAMSPDGAALFAASPGDGKLLRLDTATGAQSEISLNGHGSAIFRVQSGS
jgi:hypothetical protein